MKWLNLYRRSNELNRHLPFTWPEMTPQDWLMEALSIIGLVAMFVFIAYYYHKLPQTIPVHYNEYGSPQGSGSRNQVWIIPGISLLMHFLLPVGERFNLVLRNPGYWRRVNTQSQFNKRVRLLRYNKMIVTWGLFYISASTVRVALHTGNGMAVWFVPVFLTLIIVPTLYYHLFAK